MSTKTTPTFSDKQLFRLCKKYGLRALLARQKFIGLLPEVAKRELWRRRGFQSIFHFAKVLAGVSCEQVETVLRLKKKFEPMPELHQALVEGEVSINKLTRVASIATFENAAELVELSKKLSKNALEIIVREKRQLEKQNASLLPQTVQESLPGQTQNKINFQFEQDVQNQLQKLQEQGHDLSGILRELLAKRAEEIAKVKIVLAEQENQKSTSHKLPKSRYISVKIKEVLRKEFGTKCSVPNCHKDSEEIHHTAQFALTRGHNPFLLAPLCKAHHEITHKLNQQYFSKLRNTG